MADMFAQLGVGGIFAILVIREVLNFLARRNNKVHANPGNPGNPGHNNQLNEIRAVQRDIMSSLARIETLIRERLPKQ